MTRMTKYTRECMSIALVQHRFKEQAKTLTTTNRLLFNRVYAFMYDAETRKAMDALLAINPEALPKTDTFRVNVGFVFQLSSQLVIYSRPVGKLAEGAIEPEAVVLACDANWGNRVDIPEGDKRDPTLHADLAAHAQAIRSISDEVTTAYAEVQAALGTFTTGKKLAEGWPEAMPVIGHLIPNECRTLPAVQVDDLNKKFGLPPETKEDGETKAKRKVRASATKK